MALNKRYIPIYLYTYILGLLYYLPYYTNYIVNVDHANYDSINNTKELILEYATSQAKPLHGLIRDINLVIHLPIEVFVFLGVLGLIFISTKSIEMLVPKLSIFHKNILSLLLISNPYLHYEAQWYGQFFSQILVGLIIYYSLVLILKYRTNYQSKILKNLGIIVAIFSIVLSLNIYIAGFFHFLVLSLALTVKHYLEKPQASIKDMILFAKPFSIAIVVGATIYIFEIILLLNIFGSSLNSIVESRYTHNILIKRILYIGIYYPMFYNQIGLIVAGVLLFKYNTRTSFLLFGLTLLVYIGTYFFHIVLNMGATSIINFPNYFLSLFLIALLMFKYKSNVNLNTAFRVSSICLLCFFYLASYYTYVKRYYYEKTIRNELNSIYTEVSNQKEYNRQDIIVIKEDKAVHSQNDYKDIHYYIESKTNKSQIFYYNENSDLLPILSEFFYDIKSYRNIYGHWFNIPNIKLTKIGNQEDFIKNKYKELKERGIEYPHQNAILLHKNKYYVFY